MPADAGVKGYIFRSKGIVVWSGVGGTENSIEQNEKPDGEIWSNLVLNETFSGAGRWKLDVSGDPPPPRLTLHHQVRINLVIGDVVAGRAPHPTAGAEPRQSTNTGLIPLERLVFYQGATLDDGTRVDEHWEPGQLWIYRLEPGQATWVQTATPTLTTTGDVTATLLSVTSSEVTVRIDSNPTTTTDDDLIVQGLAIQAHPDSQVVRLYQGFQGTCGFWVNGVLEATTTIAIPRFHLMQVMPVTPPTVWNVDASGGWHTPANWSPASTPNASGAYVRFGTGITAPRTVTVDYVPTIVGNVELDSPQSYSIMTPPFMNLTFQQADASPAMLRCIRGDHTLSATSTLASNLVVNVSGGASLAFSASDGNGALEKLGAGTLRFDHFSGYLGGTTIRSGLLALVGPFGKLPHLRPLHIEENGTLDLGGRALSIGMLTGLGRIVNSDPARARLTIDNPEPPARFDGNIGAANHPIDLVVRGGGTLRFTGPQSYDGNTEIETGTTINLQGAGALPSTTHLSGAGNVVLQTLFQQVRRLSGPLNIDQITIPGHLTILEPNDDTYGGRLSGAITLEKRGSGRLTLTGQNHYTGGTLVSGGTLRHGRHYALGNTVQIQNRLDLTFDGICDLAGFSEIAVGFSGEASTKIINSNPAKSIFVVQTAAGSTSRFDGTIEGNIELGAALPGALELTGANTYSGGTGVFAGTLYVLNNSGSGTGPGPVQISEGGTLAGGGRIDGWVGIADGCVLAPGKNGAGSLLMNDRLFLSNESVLKFDLGDPGVLGGPSNDLVTVVGDLRLDGKLRVTRGPNFRSGRYVLFTYQGLLTDNTLDVDPQVGGTIDDSVIGEIALVVSVPVPGHSPWTLALLAITSVLAAGTMLRRRPVPPQCPN